MTDADSVDRLAETVTVEDEMATPIECPNCKAKTNFNLAATVNKDHKGASQLAIGLCQVCDFPVYFGLKKENQNEIWHYPEVLEVPPEGLPERIEIAFAEALSCYSSHIPNATLLMCRRAIQETMADKEAKKGDLPTQLDDLVASQKITPSLRDWAKHAQIGGRIAAHGTGGGQWGDPNQIWGTMADAEAVVAFCNAFFQYLYTLEKRNKEFMTQHVPPEA